MPPAMGSERIPEVPSPEGGIETGAERREQAAEASAALADAAAIGMPLPPSPQPIDPASLAQPLSDSPVVAGDEDVIEKEWVDKAKKIIADTPGDPFNRAEKANQLQKDYLQKRYGKVLGASE
jgi:hypothetical protein